MGSTGQAFSGLGALLEDLGLGLFEPEEQGSATKVTQGSVDEALVPSTGSSITELRVEAHLLPSCWGSPALY